MNSLKIALLGTLGVSKSAMTIRYGQDIFVDNYDCVMGNSYRKQVKVDEQVSLLEIEDTVHFDLMIPQPIRL